jgi:hypothetical protein
MMMILAVVDGDFVDREGLVILGYLREMHRPYIGTQHENPLFLELDDYQILAHFRDTSLAFYQSHEAVSRLAIFEDAARSFYQVTTQVERELFIEYAKRLIIADNSFSKEENFYINHLFALWGLR